MKKFCFSLLILFLAGSIFINQAYAESSPINPEQEEGEEIETEGSIDVLDPRNGISCPEGATCTYEVFPARKVKCPGGYCHIGFLIAVVIVYEDGTVETRYYGFHFGSQEGENAFWYPGPKYFEIVEMGLFVDLEDIQRMLNWLNENNWSTGRYCLFSLFGQHCGDMFRQLLILLGVWDDFLRMLPGWMRGWKLPPGTIPPFISIYLKNNSVDINDFPLLDRETQPTRSVPPLTKEIY